jgi:hypothetical protein
LDSLDKVLQQLADGEQILIRQADALYIMARLGELERLYQKPDCITIVDRRRKDRRREINLEKEISMARVYHVKKARKDNPVVKKGEEYWWWQHAFGRKQYSKTRPKRSQVQSSPFLSQLYALEEGFQDRKFSFDDLETERDNFVAELETLRDECQDSLDNMPEHLQDTSASGELLNERIEILDSAISEIENINIPEIEDLDGENEDEWKQEKVSEFTQELNDAWPEL